MGKHSVVEAKNQLSALIDRALAGEEVVITRHGTPVAEIKAMRSAQAGPRPMTPADMAWLDSVRINPGPGYPGAAALVRQMRDEGY